MPEERIYPVVRPDAWDSLTDDEKQETAVCGLGPVLNRVRAEGRFDGPIYTVITASRGGAEEALKQKNQSGRNGPIQSYVPDTSYARAPAYGEQRSYGEQTKTHVPTFGLAEALAAKRLGEQIVMSEMTQEQLLALPLEEQIAALEKIKAARAAAAHRSPLLDIPTVDVNLLCPHCHQNDKRNVTQNSSLGKQYYCKGCTAVWSVAANGAHFLNQILHEHACEA